LSRGQNILDAVLKTRQDLFEQYPDWSLLRLFSDGTALDVALVTHGQKKKPKPRLLQHTFLKNSDVKVLEKGFIGRRRQIQQGIRCLKKDDDKVGVLLHGTGGLGKSCLAGKLCERLKDYRLIIVHGVLDTLTFGEALKHGFKRAKDKKGLEIVEEKEEMPDKIERLCYSAFQETNYIILLDDFEKNLLKIEEGKPEVCSEAAPIVEALLKFLPYTAKMTQMIITSRYTFPFMWGGEDLVQKKLESIGLTTFQDADTRKKVSELKNIDSYPDPGIRYQLIEAGRGNPRLMEALDTLIKVKGKDLDVGSLLGMVKNKQEEFVQKLLLNQIITVQPEQFQTFLRRCAVFWLPVREQGIETVCADMKDWRSSVEQAVRLSLMEKDTTRKEYRYWVTPLIQEEIFAELEQEQRKTCHQHAVTYYQSVLSGEGDYIPAASAALIRHAVEAGLTDIAIQEGGGRFLPYLRETLAYREALEYGNYILKNISELKRDEKCSRLVYELGYLHDDTGYSKQAIEYYEQALSIDKQVYGDRHPTVATTLNNIGLAWDVLGDSKKAIEYYEQALSIDKEVYGDRHPTVARDLNNIGLAWDVLGDSKKAIEYFEQALSIGKQVYGDRHPSVATYLNNIGGAWYALGDSKKAIEYFEQALSIDKEVYGDRHPTVARDLNNIGLAWDVLGDSKKAIEYFEQALSIGKEVYGDRHPSVATYLNNIGGAWYALGDSKKAIEYYEQALSIGKEVYGDRHPTVATRLNNIGLAWKALGDSKKAIEYYEQALSIGKQVYGDRHPTVARDLNNIGLAWDVLGDSKKAIEYYEQALSIDKQVYGDRHPTVARDLNNIGSAWDALGDLKKAIDYFEQAYNILWETMGDEHPHTRSVKQWLDALGVK
jgi:tetratricopeptide (TPR) repeat protein